MKKVVLTIIGVLLFMPCMLFADMGAPAIESYKATVSNKKGAVIYNDDFKATNKTLEYGKTITVDLEEDGYIMYKDGKYIKVSDVTAVNKNYKMNDKDWGKKVDGIVLKKIELRTGPAGGYPKAGVTINPGTKVTVRAQELDGGASWVYVEYNGKTGYVDSYHGTITVGVGKAKFMTFSDTKITDPETGKKSGTLKANTVIDGSFYYLDAWSRAYYFDRADVNGVISQYDLADERTEMEGTLVRDVKVYDKIDEENEKNMKVLTTIKAGSTVKVSIGSYSNNSNTSYWYYEKDNIKGWLFNEYIDEDDIDIEENEGTDDDYLSDPEHGSAIRFKDDYIDEEEDTETTDDTIEEPVLEPEKEEVSENNNVSTDSKLQTTIILGAVAVVLLVTAIITIVLVNKKKNV